MLDERALFVGQWGLKGNRGEFEAMVESEGLPRLRALPQSSAVTRVGSMPPLFTDISHV
jgi:hypothetical protein